MDTSLIYSTTGKGLVELKTGAAHLTKVKAKVLSLIDGTSTVAQLATSLNDGVLAQQLPHAIAELVKLELIHIYDDADADGGATEMVPSIEVVELSPTDSVQAWAEAQRGARRLAEQGYYSPPEKLHQASHEAGADINRVLIVEDDPTTAKVLEFLLKEHDFQVVTAVDGDSALAELGKRPFPDVVLLDVMLPGRDGFEILRHIRSTEQLQHLPVIMVTAQISDENVMRGLKEGADGYVFKPFKWETLHACIQNVL